MRSFSLILIGILFTCARLSHAGIVLSEIMFDPNGDEASDEFVELYNNSAFPIQLAGWTISDDDGIDTLTDAGDGMLAAPYQYVLILDPDYITSGSVTYDGLVPESALILSIGSSTFGSRGLSNSSPETIRIRNTSGAVVAQYEYSTGNIQGHSEEKLRLTVPDEISNWSDSRTLNGTPGFRNSVTPPDRDLSIVMISTEPEYPPPNTVYTLSVAVANIGFEAYATYVTIFADSTDGLIYLTDSLDTGNILPADTTIVSESIRMPGTGIHEITAQLLDQDDDTTNNSLSRLFASEISQSGIIFNEIQYAPLTGRAEWIELAVAGASPVTTNGLTIADGNGISDTTKRFALPELVIRPEEYLVLSSDSAVLNENIPVESTIIVLDAANFTLNNNGDSVALFSLSGNVIDRIDYRPNWGIDEPGTTLERISKELPTNDSQNWNSSVDPEGATPGRENSRSLHVQHSSTTLSASPSPFTPNGDGQNDVTEIRYQLDQPGHAASLKIFDVRGREVREFGFENADNSGVLLWDGRKSNGTIAATGRYILLLQAENDNGTTSTTRTTVILARPK
jgi:hypothetical protein